MTVKLFHECGGKIRAVDRSVSSKPGDLQYPKDPTIKIPYCDNCRTVVGLDALRVVTSQ